MNKFLHGIAKVAHGVSSIFKAAGGALESLGGFLSSKNKQTQTAPIYPKQTNGADTPSKTASIDTNIHNSDEHERSVDVISLLGFKNINPPPPKA